MKNLKLVSIILVSAVFASGCLNRRNNNGNNLPQRGLLGPGGQQNGLMPQTQGGAIPGTPRQGQPQQQQRGPEQAKKKQDKVSSITLDTNKVVPLDFDGFHLELTGSTVSKPQVEAWLKVQQTNHEAEFSHALSLLDQHHSSHTDEIRQALQGNSKIKLVTEKLGQLPTQSRVVVADPCVYSFTAELYTFTQTPNFDVKSLDFFNTNHTVRVDELTDCNQPLLVVVPSRTTLIDAIMNAVKEKDEKLKTGIREQLNNNKDKKQLIAKLQAYYLEYGMARAKSLLGFRDFVAADNVAMLGYIYTQLVYPRGNVFNGPFPFASGTDTAQCSQVHAQASALKSIFMLHQEVSAYKQLEDLARSGLKFPVDSIAEKITRDTDEGEQAYRKSLVSLSEDSISWQWIDGYLKPGLSRSMFNDSFDVLYASHAFDAYTDWLMPKSISQRCGSAPGPVAALRSTDDAGAEGAYESSDRLALPKK